MNDQKIHLQFSKLARQIKNGKTAPSIKGLLILPIAKTNKQAYALSYIALVIAQKHGEAISEETIIQFANKLKGKENFSNKEISHIFKKANGLIQGKTKGGQEIKSNLKQRANKNLGKVVSEAVIEAVSPNGSAAVTQSADGWEQLLWAVTAILGIKVLFPFFSKK